MEIILNTKYTKTYATAENARQAVKKAGLDTADFRYLIIKLDDGRFTPVFIMQQNRPHPTEPMFHGFQLIN